MLGRCFLICGLLALAPLAGAQQFGRMSSTKELALSGNSKVVIIGAGKEGLPIILGGDTSAEKHAPAPAR